MTNDEKKKRKRKYLANDHSQKEYTTLGVLIGAAVIFFIGLLFGSGNINQSNPFTMVCTILASGLITTGGVFIILRREAPRPGLSSIKGIGALITGTLIVLAFGSSTVIMFLIFFHKFIK